MNQTTPGKNKAVILEVVTTAVNRRDFAALDKYVYPAARPRVTRPGTTRPKEEQPIKGPKEETLR